MNIFMQKVHIYFFACYNIVCVRGDYIGGKRTNREVLFLNIKIQCRNDTNKAKG